MDASKQTNHHVIERWIAIPDWDGVYEASDHGQIRRITSGGQGGFAPGYILKGRTGRYRQVRLRDGKRIEYHAVHILIARSFLGPRPIGGEVNHLDGNKLNNAISNLEWTTRRGNAAHAYAIGLMVGRKPTHCKRGHLFVDSNIIRWWTGRYHVRRCRICAREYHRAWKAQHRVSV